MVGYVVLYIMGANMTIFYDDDYTTLYHGDCEEVMNKLPDNLTTLILTDPPYTKEEFAPAFSKLATEAPRLMKVNSHLVTMVGQYLIADVCHIFRNKLRYNWIVWMQTPKSPVTMRTGIKVMGMPNLWYNKSLLSSNIKIADSFIAEGDDAILKPLHPWQKDLSWANHFIQTMTKPGDVVLDPFVGSGTVLESAKRLGRIGIGIDTDKSICQVAAKRLEAVLV